jgi:6-phosphogluconolactonase
VGLVSFATGSTHGQETSFDASKDTLVYVGTYTGAKSQSKGIYLFKLQPGTPEASDSATLVPLGLAGETRNPSYLDIDAQRRFLFAVNEVDEFEGKPTGAVSAFSINPATGRLTLLNQRASMGRGPCNLVLDKAGRNVLVANYGSGTVAVLPVAADGRLGEATSVVQHTGASVNPDRQKGPHAHCMTLDPANRFAFACDLGIDKILSYRFDSSKGTLTPNEPAFAAATPGAGPRAMVFRPDARFAYVGNELQSTVTAFRYDAKAGVLTDVQTVSTLPAQFTGRNSVAEVAMHPSGKWLYVSNRGRDSVAFFSIDPEKGTLNYIDELSTGGRTPRHFGLDPSGQRLAIANQNSDTVLTTRVDAGSGRLKPSGVLASAPTPVFVKFLPPRQP